MYPERSQISIRFITLRCHGQSIIMFMNTKPSSRSKDKKYPVMLWLAALLVVLVAILLIAAAVKAPSNGGNMKLPSTEGKVRLHGKLVCLPHKNMDGPQTLECASGFKSDDDKYYGIKDNNQKVGSTPYNEPVVIDGEFVKESSDLYQMEGSIIVESISLQKDASL